MLDIQNSISDEDILHYCHYLTTLKEGLEGRFKDLFNLQIHSWMIDPFNCNINDAHCTVVEELIELQCDEEAKYRFKKGGNFLLLRCEPFRNVEDIFVFSNLLHG
ncbi:hypothetical protein A3Q56_07113 [Intoshia linei]|uniref:Uncharacterized protein n=1 Tax=Intoshia linei TaxID=1819745 RepID=A0A177AT58_9BILA|nr:hypothetical protein A3Q56_07113 [Intoshia linei]